MRIKFEYLLNKKVRQLPDFNKSTIRGILNPLFLYNVNYCAILPLFVNYIT